MAVVAYLTEGGTTDSFLVADQTDNTNEYEGYVVHNFEESPRVHVVHDPEEGKWALIKKVLEALRYSGYHAA